MHRPTYPLMIILLATIIVVPQTLTFAQQVSQDDESPLLTEPQTPEATFDAVVLMVNLANPRLARRYLEQLMAANPDDNTILRMREKHGPAMFLKLANNRELQPLSTRLLNRMNSAFRKFATDPKRVDALIDDLSGTAAKREVAIIQMQSAGSVILPQLLTRMRTTNDAKLRTLIANTLTRLGEQNIPALLGALLTPDANLRATVIGVIGRIGTKKDAVYLWYHAFGSDQSPGVQLAAREALARLLIGDVRRVDKILSSSARGELMQRARGYFTQSRKLPQNPDGTVTVWSWSAKDSTIVASKVTPKSAALFEGSRFARQALVLSPQNEDVQALYLLFALGTSLERVGISNPLPTGPGTAHDLALLAGSKLLTKALAQSMDSSNPVAALAVLEVTAEIGSRQQLNMRIGVQSPLVAAMNYPDPRVQLGAATTILQLDPTKPFRGSSRVVEILARTLHDAGEPHGLVVDAVVERASRMAGTLDTIGLLPDIARTGQQGFRIAAERGDVELVLLHVNTIEWDLTPTVVNFRADARTARIPIVIYGPANLRSKIERIVKRYPLVAFMIETREPADFNAQLQPFLKQIQTQPIEKDERTERVQAAAFWLGHISNGRTHLFDLKPAEAALSQAVENAAVAENAIFALGSISTSTAQERMKDLAISPNYDTAIRVSAAVQLAFHIQKFGLMLTKSQIAQLENAWRSAKQAELRTALSTVVGTFKPDAKRVGDRLRQFVLPNEPIK